MLCKDIINPGILCLNVATSVRDSVNMHVNADAGLVYEKRAQFPESEISR